MPSLQHPVTPTWSGKRSSACASIFWVSRHSCAPRLRRATGATSDRREPQHAPPAAFWIAAVRLRRATGCTPDGLVPSHALLAAPYDSAVVGEALRRLRISVQPHSLHVTRATQRIPPRYPVAHRRPALWRSSARKRTCIVALDAWCGRTAQCAEMSPWGIPGPAPVPLPAAPFPPARSMPHICGAVDAGHPKGASFCRTIGAFPRLLQQATGGPVKQLSAGTPLAGQCARWADAARAEQARTHCVPAHMSRASRRDGIVMCFQGPLAGHCAVLVATYHLPSASSVIAQGVCGVRACVSQRRLRAPGSVASSVAFQRSPCTLWRHDAKELEGEATKVAQLFQNVF
ncbi:hypothetical protein K438DRAFT_2013155 [Mycena galopus ATCC 62051]|nr:hypothetical protein K438DRAFT_2013155 [Mycena galopus ATCC 62051]